MLVVTIVMTDEMLQDYSAITSELYLVELIASAFKVLLMTAKMSTS